jgi:hypothetical protein
MCASPLLRWKFYYFACSVSSLSNLSLAETFLSLRRNSLRVLKIDDCIWSPSATFAESRDTFVAISRDEHLRRHHRCQCGDLLFLTRKLPVFSRASSLSAEHSPGFSAFGMIIALNDSIISSPHP